MNKPFWNHYRIQVEDYLNFQNKRMIDYFYQPLIGTKAVALYYFLHAEEQFARSIDCSLHTKRLQVFLDLELEDLMQNIFILEKYQLLKCISSNELKSYVFLLQKPLSISHFLASQHFALFQEKFNAVTIEQLYFWLRPNSMMLFDGDHTQPKKQNSSIKQEIQKSIFASTAFDLLKKFCLDKNYPYDIKVKDLILMDNCLKQDQISNEILQLVLDFCWFKTQSFSANYFSKTIQTLKQNKIHQNISEVKIFFHKIFQNMSIDDLHKQDAYLPKWLGGLTSQMLPNHNGAKKEHNFLYTEKFKDFS